MHWFYGGWTAFIAWDGDKGHVHHCEGAAGNNQASGRSGAAFRYFIANLWTIHQGRRATVAWNSQCTLWNRRRRITDDMESIFSVVSDFHETNKRNLMSFLSSLQRQQHKVAPLMDLQRIPHLTISAAAGKDGNYQKTVELERLIPLMIHSDGCWCWWASTGCSRTISKYGEADRPGARLLEENSYSAFVSMEEVQYENRLPRQ